MKRASLISGAVVVVAVCAGCGGTDPFQFGTGGAGSTSGTGSTTGGTGSTTGGTGTTGVTGSSTGTGSSTSGTSGTGGGTGGAGGGQGTGGASGDVAPGDLVITEIMNNPAAVQDNAGEWFEIHNATAKPIDLAGLELVSGPGVHTVGSSVVIAPGGYAVLGIDADTMANGGVPVDYQYTMLKFLNAGGDLTIRTAGMVVIDAMTYDQASGLNPNGQSRNLDPKFLSASMNDTDVHWCAASSFIKGGSGDKGTPGKPNDPCP